ncbi:MAG: formate/nitrite transporter family protein [Planctomycetes bacterium]|nr:formate/nitrite transporter family protein [Planctomycetota bacterium]
MEQDKNTVAEAAKEAAAPGVAVDALPPPGIGKKAIAAGVSKAQMEFTPKFLLAVLAGAYVGMGAVFYTVVVTETGTGYGLTRLLGGLAFCLGLILVVVGGAALFTGNNLIIMAALSRKITVLQLLRNWAIVYAGNFAGSVVLALLMTATRIYGADGGKVGATMVNIANGKCGLPFGQAVALGVMCNVLVCLAVWLCFSGRTVVDKVVAIIFPITAFVAAGFEHSVANMYFISAGLLTKGAGGAPGAPGPLAEAARNAANLTWGNFFVKNLLPVTLGNIVGGAVFVGAIYWVIFHRKKTE